MTCIYRCIDILLKNRGPKCAIPFWGYPISHARMANHPGEIQAVSRVLSFWTVPYVYIYIYMDVYIRYYLHAFSDCWNIYTWKYLVLLLELNILQTFCNESWDLRSVKPIICIFFAAQICSIWNIPTARDVCGISRPPLRVPTWAHVQLSFLRIPVQHVILMDHGEKNTLNNGETQGCSGGNKRTSLILDFEN